jgi:hypothetical protein
MTYWYENPDRHKDGRHWISVCISLASKTGLHLDHTEEPKPDHKLRNMLWWSVFTRDRLIALGLQQPPVIKDEVHSSIPMLALEDLDINTQKYAKTCYGVNERSLARIFIEKVKLCRCVKDDLYSWDCQPIHHHMATVAPKPRQTSLWLSKLELDDWLQDLPDNISFRPKPFLPAHNADLIFHSHCAWLKMVYLEIYSTIHRQLDFLSEKYSPSQPLSLDGPECPILRSAVEITLILQDLYQKQLIYYLPTTSVAMILRAGIIHIQEMFSGDPHVGAASFRRLSQCILALQQLGRRYGSAFFLATLLGAPKGASVITCSPDEILAHVDIESLDKLTVSYAESSVSTILKIREPYDRDIISGLKSRKVERAGDRGHNGSGTGSSLKSDFSPSDPFEIRDLDFADYCLQ